MNKKPLVRMLSFLSAGSGFMMLGYVFMPFIKYELQITKTPGAYLSPIPKHEELLTPQSIKAADSDLDYTKASNWFIGGPVGDKVNGSYVKYYTISVPKLRIEEASVEIGGEDLSQNMIHYTGTALPGKPGNAVIFGHSILPQFFNPKDYMTIFSTLHLLEAGNEILVRYDGISYRYIVEDKFEVLPTDIQILEQNNSDSFLTLVTCAPPGHPLKPRRLIVRARMARNIGNANIGN